MLSQWMGNKNWNIGANLSTGEKGWTDVDAEAMLSGRLLNNRLMINGNFGYKENVKMCIRDSVLILVPPKALRMALSAGVAL